MESITAWVGSLPPAADFFPLTPEAYTVLLGIFQYFPIITIIQWLIPFYPAGKTSLSSPRLNFLGRYAWCFMESIGPLNLLYNLRTTRTFFPGGELPPWHKLVAFLYVLHYLNRALITPLFLAPSMSPIHLLIICLAVGFNYLNSSCLAGWLLGYGTPVLGTTAPTSVAAAEYLHIRYLPYIGVALFVAGMYGNIRAEGILFRLRREEGDRRAAVQENKGKTTKTNSNKYDKVYILPPPEGYFRTILFPHYVSEWFEWLGLLLIGFAITPRPSSEIMDFTTPTPPIPLAPPYTLLAKLLLVDWNMPFPLPAIVLFVNIVLTTAARASWGRTWYVQRFGKEKVGRRGSFIPYFKWL